MKNQDPTMNTLRDEYTAKIKQQLDELNAHAAVMEAKMQVAKAEVRDVFVHAFKDFKAQF